MEITEAKSNHLAFFLLKLFGVLENLQPEGPQPSSTAGLSEKWWRPGGCDLQGGKYNDGWLGPRSKEEAHGKEAGKVSWIAIILCFDKIVPLQHDFLATCCVCLYV